MIKEVGEEAIQAYTYIYYLKFYSVDYEINYSYPWNVGVIDLILNGLILSLIPRETCLPIISNDKRIKENKIREVFRRINNPEWGIKVKKIFYIKTQ
jgi:hypothetical protein